MRVYISHPSRFLFDVHFIMSSELHRAAAECSFGEMTIEGGIIGGSGVPKHAARCDFLVTAIHLAPQAMKTTNYLGARRMRRDWWAHEPRM